MSDAIDRIKATFIWLRAWLVGDVSFATASWFIKATLNPKRSRRVK